MGANCDIFNRRWISSLKLYLYIVSVIVMFGVMFRLCVGAFGLDPNALAMFEYVDLVVVFIEYVKLL